MYSFQNLSLYDFDYTLPDESIALFPNEKRDECKLLVYNLNNIKEIIHTKFYEISDYLSPDSLIIINSTRVLPARLNFYKKTGASIELLLLHPSNNSVDIQIAMTSTSNTN